MSELSNLPAGWSVQPLHNFISELESGVSVNADDRKKVGSEIGVLKTSCVSLGKFIANEHKAVWLKDELRAKVNPREGEIIVSRMNTPDLVGESGLVTQTDKTLFLPDRLWQTVARADVPTDFKWLIQILNWGPVRKNIRDAATGTSNSMKNISKREFLGIEVPTPSLAEQQGIAEVLSALDELIEATEALIAKKVLVRSAILTALVNDTNASSVAIDMLASKVGSGVTPTGGSEVYTSYGVTFVRSQNVLNESIELSDVAFITNEIHAGMAASKLQVHDVLLNITGASIGRCCTFPEGIGEANVNQHVCIIRLHNPCQADAALLAALICSEFGQRELNKQISGGNREGLNYQQVRAMALPWPQDAAIRAEMAAVLQAAKSEIEELEAEVMKLQQQKQGLMHDLLTGKTRVLQ